MSLAAAINGLAGGLLIGLAAVLLMLTLGRIAGICGIMANLLTTQFDREWSWRATFMAGLMAGALLAGAAGFLDWRSLNYPAGLAGTAIAGLLVGVGTTLGAGCTSGHGVCGLSRLSGRSLAATLTFMATALVTVFVVRHVI